MAEKAENNVALDERKRLLDHILKLEDVLLARAHISLAAARSRFITQDTFDFDESDLSFTIALKEIVERPQFFTFRYRKPLEASFVFTSFGLDGSKMINKGKLKEMLRFLKEHGELEHFDRLIEEAAGHHPD